MQPPLGQADSSVLRQLDQKYLSFVQTELPQFTGLHPPHYFLRAPTSRLPQTHPTQLIKEIELSVTCILVALHYKSLDKLSQSFPVDAKQHGR